MSRTRSLSLVVLVLAFLLGSSAAADSFAYRGVIEGFYGPPWPSAARLEFLQWMLDHGMNLYIHAPKNDPYQRLQWRSPYPQSEIDQFAAEIALAGSQLAWVPSISPGQPLIEAADPHDVDICFSCPADFALLVAKLDQFWNIGARTLMVSFDDVIKASTHPEDALAYGVGDYAYGVMNGDLLNRLFDHYCALAVAEGNEFRLITGRERGEARRARPDEPAVRPALPERGSRHPLCLLLVGRVKPATLGHAMAGCARYARFPALRGRPRVRRAEKPASFAQRAEGERRPSGGRIAPFAFHYDCAASVSNTRFIRLTFVT